MDVWIPWLYHYGVGGLILLAGLAAIIASGALRWSIPRDRRLLTAIAAGYLVFLLAHAAWIAVAAA